MKLGMPNRQEAVFVLIDIQEKFLPVIHDIRTVIENSNRLIKAASIMNIPLIVTEQYPKGLGRTLTEIELPQGQDVIEKVSFDCFGCEEFLTRLNSLNRNTLILFGIEAHVCVLKTALSGIAHNYEVHVVADAVSSRTEENKSLALERLRQSGVFITSTEMIIFQLMDRAGTDEFRSISRLIK